MGLICGAAHWRHTSSWPETKNYQKQTNGSYLWRCALKAYIQLTRNKKLSKTNQWVLSVALRIEGIHPADPKQKTIKNKPMGLICGAAHWRHTSSWPETKNYQKQTNGSYLWRCALKAYIQLTRNKKLSKTNQWVLSVALRIEGIHPADPKKKSK